MTTIIMNNLGYIECLLVIQFTAKAENYEIQELVDRISNLDHKYINFLYSPLILEKLFEKFHKNKELTLKLVELFLKLNNKDGKNKIS